MSDLVVTNWFGDIVSRPREIVEVHSVEEIARVLLDRERYPSPVRAVGSNHSTAMCGVAQGGTLIKMKGMNRILHIGQDTVTAEAGAQYIDVAEELRRRSLQFHVCTEIGNLTIGSAACAGTKDASMPGEYGQVSSYVTAVKMILPNGTLLEASEDKDPELMRKIRCSYGTFGIVYEATLKVRPLTPLDVRHETFTTREFLDALPEWRRAGVSIFYFMFPFVDRVTVEFRKYNPGATGATDSSAWANRNRGWGVVGPFVASMVESYVPWPGARYHVTNALGALWRSNLEHRVRHPRTLAPDQTIRYPPVGGRSKYTFSLFAFDADSFPSVLTEFFAFCKDYYQRAGYRANLSYVGYLIAKDRQAILSYSWDGDVLTLDPVSTGNPGWRDFLREYNRFCSERKGKPLLNQTFGVTREIAERAFGDRLTVMAQARRTYDPDGRLLNDYFRELFVSDEPHVSETSVQDRRLAT
jgi:FAD/FMN-containing dehydrogenase